MCGGSGGGKSGGGGGGGSSEAGTNGDAGQPGEVVRQANNEQLKRVLGRNMAEHRKIEQGIANIEKAQEALVRSGPTGPGSKNYDLDNRLTRALNKGMDRKEILRTRIKNIVKRRGKPT